MRAEEEQSLKNFRWLYHVATFILLTIIAILVYSIQYQTQYNLTILNMQNRATKISSAIINSHMKNKQLKFSNIYDADNLQFSLYSINGEKKFGNIDRNIDLTNEGYIDSNDMIVVDKSALGYLGIGYVVVLNNDFYNEMFKLKVIIFGIFMMCYMLVCMIGIYLIRLFMKPIQNERDRLNNFIKDTTHELNTPITAIMMCTNKDAIPNEKNIERIYISAKRISEIYKDLTYLLLSRDHKKSISNISVSNIMEEELEYFEILAFKKNIKITSEIEETSLNINNEDFKRIFSNLLSNAIKYNNRNGTIYISLKNKILFIKDTGIGIDEKKIKNVFNRFYRATTESGGFGLGLNIVHEICEEYSIKIIMDSKLKVGTIFTLDLSKI